MVTNGIQAKYDNLFIRINDLQIFVGPFFIKSMFININIRNKKRISEIKFSILPVDLNIQKNKGDYTFLC